MTTPAPPNGPPRGAHPRVLLAAAVQHWGEPQVREWCLRLVRGQQTETDPDLAWLGGSEDWLPYWSRVWGTRGLLYIWQETTASLDGLTLALADEHWRVREMACKVVRAHRVQALTEPVADLAGDTVARVRAAAERALHTLAGDDGSHAPGGRRA